MEFREYLAIFRKKTNFFWGIVLLFLMGGVLFDLFQPVRYVAELNLNVTRKGSEKTNDYHFDDFYRLQADEKFADTIVRWIESSRIRLDIQNEVGSDGQKMQSIGAQRLSSQMVAVTCISTDQLSAEKIANAVPKVINREAEKLNQSQNEENWFLVVADNPVIRLANWPWHKIVFFSLLVGFFVAFWAVLIRHYIET